MLIAAECFARLDCVTLSFSRRKKGFESNNEGF